MRRTRLLLTLLLLVGGTLGGGSAAAAEPSGPLATWLGVPPGFRTEPLRVQFHDPYGLLPRKTRERLQQEVVRAFESSGIALRFVGHGGAAVIPATLYPEFPEKWDIPFRAIGVAIGSGREQRPVFLSLGAAERALGSRSSRRPTWNDKQRRFRRRPASRHSPRLGTALGRVLAHEITHSIAPDCPHTATGLMAARLSRRMLTAPGVGFDALAIRHLRRSAANLGLGAP